MFLVAMVATGAVSACSRGASSGAAASSTTATATAPAPSPTASTSPGAAASATDETSAPAGFPGNLRTATSDPSSGSAVTVRDIRIGAHPGFDRVVFDVGGRGVPGWNVRYVDEATSQGSGKHIDLPGAAVLEVDITGAAYPSDSGVKEYSGPNPLSSPGTPVVTQVAFDGTFEGTTEAFIGTRARAPFRVYRLDNPTRIVVEVADAT